LVVNKKFIFYSPFHIAFLVWCTVGSILLFFLGKKDLFELVNSRYSSILDVVMYGVTMMGQAEVIIPVLLALMFIPRLRNKWYFVAAVCCNVTPLILQQLMKQIFHAPRPLQYYQHATWIHKLPDWPELLNNSFPSGHSQGAFSFFCFLSLLLPIRYKKIGIFFFILALAVGYSRLYLAAHFFEDVYAGSIIGVLITTILFNVLNRYKPIGETPLADAKLAH